MEIYESTKIAYIYGLYEIGKEDEIRYIGKSIRPKTRIKEHIKNRMFGDHHKNFWIRKVIDSNSNIGMRIIEISSEDKWEEREIFWIKYYRDNGYDLVNGTDGGESGSGIKYKISYEDCKIWIKENIPHVDSLRKWDIWIKSSDYNDLIPKYAEEVYLNREEWISWGDFLGTNRVQDNKIIDNYVSYDKAKEWVIENLDYMNLSQTKWKELARAGKIPIFIPNRPERFYKKRGWVSFGDFYGNGRVQNQKKYLNKKAT